MRVKITVTKITREKDLKSTGTITAQDIFVEGAELEFKAAGTLLEVYNPMSRTTYLTDFAFSGVDAVLAAAPVTGGHFVLT